MCCRHEWWMFISSPTTGEPNLHCREGNADNAEQRSGLSSSLRKGKVEIETFDWRHSTAICCASSLSRLLPLPPLAMHPFDCVLLPLLAIHHRLKHPIPTVVHCRGRMPCPAASLRKHVYTHVQCFSVCFGLLKSVAYSKDCTLTVVFLAGSICCSYSCMSYVQCVFPLSYGKTLWDQDYFNQLPGRTRGKVYDIVSDFKSL